MRTSEFAEEKGLSTKVVLRRILVELAIELVAVGGVLLKPVVDSFVFGHQSSDFLNDSALLVLNILPVAFVLEAAASAHAALALVLLFVEVVEVSVDTVHVRLEGGLQGLELDLPLFHQVRDRGLLNVLKACRAAVLFAEVGQSIAPATIVSFPTCKGQSSLQVLRLW